MYSTCLFCSRDLGRNEVVEQFPVGRRLAYDAAKGRLWVVCGRCERWNLTPMEERWEAIEECERAFRDTRVRVATDHIGLARLREGLELVRIGAPLRPEFAAWRYGDQFGRRRRRHAALVGSGVVAATVVATGGLAIGASLLVALSVANTAYAYASGQWASRVVARLPAPRGEVALTLANLGRAGLRLDARGRIELEIFLGDGRIALRDGDAERALARLLPAFNRSGASSRAVADAVRAIELRGSAARYVTSVARTASQFARPAPDPIGLMDVPTNDTGLYGLSPTQRLALEMALHEEQERRALDGELADLERAWRQADEIAAIADDLLLPDGARVPRDGAP
ncbi:MAG: hypothetical protein JO180_06960 [Gemmatirosa sp.]|nr:hypothetical protein [Gemmatirosa sp.]